jgi:hypothetical protein
MLGSGSMMHNDMPSDLMQKVKGVCTYFEQAVEQAVQIRRLPPMLFPALFPCNILCVADKKTVHVVFSNINAGGLPTQKWLDRRGHGLLSREEVGTAAVVQHGLINPYQFAVSIELLDWPDAVRRESMVKLSTHYVDEMVKIATRPRAIAGYEGLQPLLDRFSSDHPDFEKNVLIVMRFRAKPQFLEIHQVIKSGLANYGLNGLRVDDKSYPLNGDLWNNICVYMMGCKYAVCVFEEIDEREFNPNVPLEYGFMRAMNRQVLLLKDQRMPKLPSDMTGKLYRDFDTYNIDATISEQLAQWVERDLGLRVIR